MVLSLEIMLVSRNNAIKLIREIHLFRISHKGDIIVETFTIHCSNCFKVWNYGVYITNNCNVLSGKGRTSFIFETPTQPGTVYSMHLNKQLLMNEWILDQYCSGNTYKITLKICFRKKKKSVSGCSFAE